MDHALRLMLQSFGATWWFVVPILIFAVLWRSPMGNLHENDNQVDRDGWIDRLTQGKGRERYQSIMDSTLGWIDERLSERELDKTPTPGRIAWSLGLLKFLMLLAVLYPILAFVTQWIAGSALMFGGVELVEPGTGPARGFTGFWLVGFFSLCVLAAMSKSRWRVPLFIGATAILFSGLFLADRFDVPFDVAYAVAFAVAYAVAVAVVVAGAIGFVSAVAGAVALALALAVTVAGAVPDAVAIVFAGAVAFAGALEQQEHKDSKRRWRLGYLALLLAVLTVVASQFWHPNDRNVTAYVFLFLGVFPIFNVLADFASVGLTRYLFRNGLTGSAIANAALDLIGGICIFFVLGFALLTYLHVVVPADGQALLSIPGLFDDLATRPGDMWWLFFMLFSTLIPTAAHAMVALFAFVMLWPERWRNGFAWMLNQKERNPVWWGSKLLCLSVTLSIWLPILALWWLFTTHNSTVLQAIVAVFRWFAGTVLGAL